MANHYVVSFGSNDRYLELSKNITNQFNLIYPEFRKIVFSPEDLTQEINDFAIQNRRGYGYYIWKPYLINETLKKTEINDVIFYIDGRCGIETSNFLGFKKKKIKWVENFLKSKNDIAAWEMGSNLEYQWTSQDLFTELNIAKNLNIKNSSQYAATFILLRNNPKTIKFISDWLDLCSKRELLMGEKFKKYNQDGFKEHRHDQSALSLLLKLSKEVEIYKVKDKEYLKTPNIRVHKYQHPN